jgi:predicted RNA-binding Zn-ribbon protein involved in translation (DUF1610 family)
MKCPYCGKDMIYGVIQSPQEINWKPKKAKIFGAGFFHKDSIVLSDFNSCGSAIIAYNCQDCKKILVNYDNNECDYNNSQ